MRKAGAAAAKTPGRHGVLSAAAYSLELAIVAASYVGVAAMWLSAPSINLAATPLWPPSGLALALVLVRGFRIWPAILVGLFSFQLMGARPVLESASIGIGSLLAGLAGAWMISRWSNGRKTFETPAGIAKFALISFVPTAMISSIVALGAFILGDNDGFAGSVVTWATWWLADAAGTLIVAPVIVLWATTPLRPFFNWGLLETVAVFILSVAIGVIAYSPLIGSDLIGNNLDGLLPYRCLLGLLVLLPFT